MGAKYPKYTLDAYYSLIVYNELRTFQSTGHFNKRPDGDDVFLGAANIKASSLPSVQEADLHKPMLSGLTVAYPAMASVSSPTHFELPTCFDPSSHFDPSLPTIPLTR